ncbi:MAG: hypothetical protein QY319_05065 [Candidatus Kapaibacterium sp.]|nr:MAG: hypothetical protein QY319_05065 [Candidatus Kapabacteria bacterium]
MIPSLNMANVRTGRIAPITDFLIAYRLIYHAIDQRYHYAALRNAPLQAFHDVGIGLDGSGQFVLIKLDASGLLLSADTLSVRDVDLLVRAWQRKEREAYEELMSFLDSHRKRGGANA